MQYIYRENIMAKNTGENYRKGSVKDRTQLQHPQNSNLFIKRDTETGKFMSVKENPYKGVAQEVDNRRK